MKFPIVALSLLSLASADNIRAESRRLSLEKIAGYEPGSQVTDHCAIDLDQAAIEVELGKGTDAAYALAERIYNEGAHSKSFAKITLATGLTDSINKGKVLLGKDSTGKEVKGKAYETYPAGTTVIQFQYATSDTQSSYVNCQVGALEASGNLAGCLNAAGTVTVEGGATLNYTYNPSTDNDNGRTIAGFSTNAGKLMSSYKDFGYFKDYYGTDDYGHEWVTAAFEKKSTNFANGNADFTKYDFAGRTQAIQKGTVYFNIFMYVIREFEDALDDCKKDCNDCNDDPVHAWDEGVCFYTGSIEGKDGLTADGKLLHQLADKRCANFKTCGKDGDSIKGTAKLNYDLFTQYGLGRDQLTQGKCDAARITKSEVARLMYIPFIQGALRYAYKVGELNEGEKSKAEGAVFAAAVLPRVHAASASAAKTIYDNMKVGATSTDAKAVKEAFESVYSDMGITCEEVGGLYNDALDEYFPGMAPCGMSGSASFSTTLATVVAVGAAAFMAFF